MKEFWYTIQFIFTVLGGWLGMMGTPASRRLVGERTSSGADEFSCLHGNDRAKLARTRRL